ncbi:histidine kinase N-terminal 7TM domain-containing protein [Halovivax limisalsi]|uniref:histidine kinase N-terminal 7TM domain-containing protein n=1 Tax=Halovivax limisalsi TaxID=1453760 RepID=UPI001FFD3FB9|nr:histidine kinase N-terminal 7TM domain-containing protein [Halovivax limisalsi]
MTVLATTYMVAVAIGAVTSVAIAALALRNPEHAETRVLAVLTAGIALWTGGDLASMLASSREWTMLWIRTVHWFGVAIVPTTIFLFIVVYTGRGDRLSRRRLAALYALPVAIFLLALTNSWHRLLWTDIAASDATPVGYALTYGPAFAAYVLYSYGLLAVGTVLLGGFIGRSRELYRGQATLLMIAAVAPWGSNLLYILGDSELEPTSLGFAIAAVALAVAVFRYRLTDILPIARDAVVEHINDGVVVLDRDGRILDANAQAAPYLCNGDVGTSLGQPADAVLPTAICDWLADGPLRGDPRGPDSAGGTASDGPAGERGTDRATERGTGHRDDTDVERTTASTTVRRTRGGDQQYLAVDTTALLDGDRWIGQLLIIRDVTEQQRYERELERQNDRLDRFASVVSHDLRNPLNVADGYLSLLAERYDDPEIDEVGSSLDRMEAIIEDVLTLARNGDEVADRTLVDLGTLATAAWNGVDTGDATLQIETGEHRVAADESRLTQAFENLFRNAVEHGGEGVTVSVGTIDEADAAEWAVDSAERTRGFYVADDGTGISEGDREAILESGYTTNADGTGLGLSIVRTIVEAHGWSLSVAESAAGGARFEICYDEYAAAESTRPDAATDAAESPAPQSTGE